MTRREEIFNTVVDVLEEQLVVDPEDITEQTSLHEDLNMDSLDDVEVTMALEERYNVTVTDEEAARCVTVKDIVDLVDQLVNHTEQEEVSATETVAEDASK